MKKNKIKKGIFLLLLTIFLFVSPVPTSTVPTYGFEYKLISPLPEFGDTFETGEEKEVGAGDLSKYLNIMIPLFIGLCAILAVIIIVLGGIKYMTSELISSKGEGLEMIKNAVFGLLLALGAWLILYTINPKILDVDLTSLEEQVVKIELMDENEDPMDAVFSDAGAPSSPTMGCPEGIGRTTGGISVCNRILSRVEAMITAAGRATPACVLTGGGYRSPETQKLLRIKNCHGDYTNKNPNPACNPMTALPGASRHQQGLAIDFKSSGELIQTTDNVCFLWLKAHAANYGLYNLAREPWHWSIDGR